MLSFIIPTKNEESILEKTLSNISAFKGEKEIIVSDGKSTDRTREIARKYGKVVEYTKEEKQTIGAGRNAGAEIAVGDYFVFLDADVSFLDVNVFFNKAISVFETNPKIDAMTVCLRVLPEFETWADHAVFGTLNFCFNLLNNVFHFGASSGEFQMIRADVFRKSGGFNESLAAGEDHEFFQRLAKSGNTYFEKSLTIYHTGRREHEIGWPKLLLQWSLNGVSVFFTKKAVSKEWKVIR